MQTTSELYKSILQQPYDVETKLDIYTADGKTLVGSYGEDVLVSGELTGKLFSPPNVGEAVSWEIDVKMLMPTETLPRMAMLKPFFRIRYGTDISEWIQKGVYFIDTRSTDKQTGVLTIHGYDSMLKTEQIYCPDGSGTWPRTMATVVNDICASIGVTLDSRTTISSTYKCQLDTTLSMREYLAHIAAAHAGMFMISDTGQMRLVPLKHDSTAVADLGQDVDLLEHSPALAAFDRVVINVSHDSFYAYPVSYTGTGRTLELDCRWGSAAMAEAIYGLVNGFVYQPYETGNALISPAVEVGDAVTIDGKLCGIYQMNIKFGAMLGVKLAAPSDGDVVHEYHYATTTEKLKKQLANTTAELRVLADSIESIVTSTSVTYRQDTVPEAPFHGNLWFVSGTEDVVDGNNTYKHGKWYYYDASDALNPVWVETTDIGITENSAEIEQTAHSITATVAESQRTWDTSGVSIDHYGYGVPESGDYTSDDTFLDNATGYVYTYNGTAWTYTKALSEKYYSKQSSVDITSDGISISSDGSIELNAGASLTANSSTFSLDGNGNINTSGDITCSGTLTVSGDANITGSLVADSLSTGSTLSWGSGNFSVNNEGVMTAKSATLSSATVNTATINSATLNTATANNLTINDSVSIQSSGSNGITIDGTSRYNGYINLGDATKIYGVSTGAVIYSNGGNFQVFTTASGVSRIYLNGQYIESFDDISGGSSTAVFG